MNWKVRAKNPLFWAHIAVSLLTTILVYNSMQVEDLNTWTKVFATIQGVVSNPYLLFSCIWSIWNAIYDPTSQGLTDCTQVKSLSEPDKG